MQKEVAERLAVDIERHELRECMERLNRCRIAATTVEGPERDELLTQAQMTEAELRQWSGLVSVVRASVDDPDTKVPEDLLRTGTY